jgi:hypothetical protein
MAIWIKDTAAGVGLLFFIGGAFVLADVANALFTAV